MTKFPSSASKWLWPLVVALLTALLVIWFFSPLGDVPVSEPAPERTPSSEWTTAPEGPAVEVKLPVTPVRRAPAETSSPSPTASPAE